MAKAQRTKPAATQVCPTCGKSVVPDGGYCPNCGSPIDVAAASAPPAGGTSATSAIVCPVCSTTNPPGTEFCSNCGAPLAQVLSTPLASGGDGLSTGIKCGVCGHDIPPGDDYCPNCGAPRSASVQLQAPGSAGAAEAPPGPTTCPNCGAKLRPGARFCRECGTRFDSIATDQKSQGGLSQLKPGQVLAGRYKIQSVIGGGGMGAVFKGVDMNLTSRAEPEGRQVAVKAILDTT
ncbi:MAG TPA: zinc ribbon domain-containing protein, partial [Chloroflexia bacterium]|nr:zinc ribbon domain-containing protein [Chloroflexia bacterium]